MSPNRAPRPKPKHRHRFREFTPENKRLMEGGASWFRCDRRKDCHLVVCIPGRD